MNTAIQFFGSTIGENLDLDPDYRKIYDYARVNGMPRPPKNIVLRQNQLIIDLKDLGVYQIFDTFHVGVNGFNNGKGYAQINWVNPSTFNFLNSAFDVPWDKIKGFGGSLTTNAEWRAAYTQINYQLTNASIFCYVSQLTSSGTNIVIRGGLGPSASDGLIQVDNLSAQRINQGNTQLSSAMDMTGLGHKFLMRLDSDNVVGWNNSNRMASTRAVLGLDGAYSVTGRGNTAYTSYIGAGGSFDELANDFQTIMDSYFNDINNM